MQLLQIEGLKELLSTPKKIFITTHVKPDGDAIGSTMGLYHYFIQKGHTVQVVSPSEVPDYLQWIPQTDTIINAEKDHAAAKSFIEDCDIICCLDFNKYDRTASVSDLLAHATQPKILIDHHLNPAVESFDYLYSDDDKSSTCEMVYDFIYMMDDDRYINEAIMQSLYTGLMTDTGSFRFPATTANVHLMIADFKKRGFNHATVHEQVFDVWSENRMRLMGYLLYKKMVINHEYGYGYIYMSKKELEELKAGINDTEGIVNYITSINGIKVGIFVTERKEGLKLSFRSKGAINVNEFANTNFGGGGHFNAAGASSLSDWSEIEQMLNEKMPILIKESLNLNK